MTNWGIASLRKRDWQSLSTWLFTIVILAGGFGLYSYLYVERREQYFTERKLRELRILGDRLKLQIENIGNNILPNAVKAAESYAAVDCKSKTPDPALKVYETEGAVITSAKSASLEETCGFLAVSNKTQLALNFKLDKLVEYRLTPSAVGSPGTGAGPPSRVTVRIEGDTPALLFTYQTSQSAQNSRTPRWRGRIDVQNLLGQSGLDSFDQLVVTDLKGDVQFQVGTTSVVPTNVASLVERAARMDSSSKSTEGSNVPPLSGWPSVRDSTSVVTVNLAGEDYLLFLQPVKIALLGNETADQLSAGSNLDWRIAGLISKDRFKRDSSTFSYTTIVVFLFVLLLLVFAEPFIKIRSLGVLDRLQKRDVIFLFVSAALTTALFTLFAADLYVYGKLENEVDSQLEVLAKDVQHKFDEDLSSLLRTLRNLSEEEVPPEELTAVGDLLGTSAPENVKPSEDPCKGALDAKVRSEDMGKAPSSEALKNEFMNGALFERIVWIDPCGKQRRKWTIYSSVTPLIQVGERPYFQKVKNGQLWRKSVDNKDVCFWLGPIESWNTGERLATLSVRGPATSKEDSKNASCEAHPDQGAHWVLSLDAFLPSLRSAVLPPGFGFVVIDGEGSVLFHSDPGRHLRENFFEESDQKPALRAAVFGRATAFFSASYLGTDHRVHSRPFDAPWWTLLVFYDKHFLRTTNVEIISTTLILFLTFLALQFPALAILWFRDTQWLWYEKARRTAYPPYLVGIFVLASLLLCVIACFSPVSVAYAAFLIPSIVLFLTYFTFGSKGPNQKARPKTGDHILSIGPPLVVVLVLFYGCWLERKSSELVFITLGTALLVGLTFVPSIKRWLNGARWFPSTGKCYLLTTAAVLVLVGFLPALAFFRVAYENEMVLLLKHGQYRLEESLSARRAKWLETAVKIPGLGGKNFLETRMKETKSREVNEDFFFPCSYSPTVVGTSTPFRSPLGYVLSEIRQHMLFDPVAIESQGLLQDSLTDDSATWLGGHARCLVLVSGVAGLSGTRPTQLKPVEVPQWWKTNSFKWFLVLALLVVALIKLVTFITVFIAKRVFLFDLEVPSEAEEAPDPAAFDAVWRSCTVEEKIALYDLVTDGFLNSKNRSISSLLKRGLLSFSALRLANDSFRDVILSEGASDDALAPDKQDELSAWQKMKWPLLAAFLSIAVFLFFSQRRVFDSGVGFLGALAAAATSLFNLFDHVRGNRR